MDQPFQYIELPRNLVQAAIDLQDFGIHEAAWAHTDALALLAYLDGSLIPVLGGDVLSAVQPLTYAYANWHTDPLPHEEPCSYAARSQRAAREYIAHYPDVEAWFVLVLGEPVSTPTNRSSNDR